MWGLSGGGKIDGVWKVSWIEWQWRRYVDGKELSAEMYKEGLLGNDEHGAPRIIFPNIVRRQLLAKSLGVIKIKKRFNADQQRRSRYFRQIQRTGLIR